MKENLKKINIKKLILIGSIILVFLALCYYLYHEVPKSNPEHSLKQEEIEKEKEEEEKEEPENKEDSTEEPSSVQPTPKKELTKEEKELEEVKIFTIYFGKYYPTEDMTQIENQDLLRFGLEKIGWEETITKEQMENKIKEYFGYAVTLKHENIHCPGISGKLHDKEEQKELYYYENGVYKRNDKHPGHGGVKYRTAAKMEKVSQKQNNDFLTKNYKILYGNWCSDTCGPTTSFAYHFNDENFQLKNENGELRLMDDLEDTEIKELMDKTPITSFLYRIEEDGTLTLLKIQVN